MLSNFLQKKNFIFTPYLLWLYRDIIIDVVIIIICNTKVFIFAIENN